MTTQGGEDYMTPEEAAAYLGLSRRTIDRYADSGLLRRNRQGLTRRVVYKRSEVETLKDQMTGITPDIPPEES